MLQSVQSENPPSKGVLSLTMYIGLCYVSTRQLKVIYFYLPVPIKEKNKVPPPHILDCDPEQALLHFDSSFRFPGELEQ